LQREKYVKRFVNSLTMKNQLPNPLFDETLDAAIPKGYQPQLTIGLVRSSGHSQNQGSSESRQLAGILAVCNRYQWPSPTWIVLRGVSDRKQGENGTPRSLDPNKSVLGMFIAAAKTGKVPAGTILMADNRDRFSRVNPAAAEHALMTLLRNGVSVLFLSTRMFLEPGDKDNVMKRSCVMIELSRANREGNTKSKYVRDGITNQIRKARAGQRVNFGGKIPRWIKWDANAKDYKPNGQKWTTVCRIVKEALEHKIWGQIVRTLNADKVPCLAGGKAWKHTSVYRLLRSPALRGDFVIRNETLKGYSPAVVTSESQWHLLQARLKRIGKALLTGGSV
jgi:DNA invertase Pin-like site-specific DNA recombinase